MSSADAVIIGAGAAGLAAAKQLRAHGLSVRVLEAMDRIGGRAYTVKDRFDIPFDWGCAWLHAADRNPFFEEGVNRGFTLQYHDLNLDRVYFGDRRATAQEMARIFMADFELAALMKGTIETSGRLSALIKASTFGQAIATYSGPMDFAQDADEISTADAAEAADLNPNFLVKEGFGTIVTAWGWDEEVELGCPVNTLSWRGTGVVAETARGNVEAKTAIVTVSAGVLAFGGLRFSPNLPAAYEEAIHNLPMGLLAKIPLAIRGDRHGLNPFEDILIEKHGHHDVYFLCFPFDSNLLIGFVGGDFAWELAAAGEAAAVDFVTQTLSRTFGTGIEKQIVAAAMTDWGANRWTRGAYAAARPGYAGARKLLLEPVGERIYFAGEALGGPLMQTCAGARLSGVAAAGQVIRKLTGKSL